MRCRLRLRNVSDIKNIPCGQQYVNYTDLNPFPYVAGRCAYAMERLAQGVKAP